MNTLFRQIAILSLSLAFPAAAFAAASSVDAVLGIEGNREVTRGEFLKASVILLGLSVDTDAAIRDLVTVLDWVKAQGYARPHLLGWSWGGRIASGMAQPPLE